MPHVIELSMNAYNGVIFAMGIENIFNGHNKHANRKIKICSIIKIHIKQAWDICGNMWNNCGDAMVYCLYSDGSAALRYV